MSGNSERPVRKIFPPVPPDLVKAKVWLEYRRRLKVSGALRMAIDAVLADINLLLDYIRSPIDVGK